MASSKKTKSNSVHYIGFVLDETGSMSSVREATVSGFNEYVGSLKADKDIVFTLTRFNSVKTTTPYRAVPIKDVTDLSDYDPDATTPLYDAIGAAIHAAEGEVQALPAKTTVLIVVMTDGQENASQEFDRKRIFDLIKSKEQQGWTFAYMGANQDAWAVGASIGVPQGNSFNYDAAQPKQAFSRAAVSTLNYARNAGSPTNRFFMRDDDDNRA